MPHTLLIILGIAIAYFAFKDLQRANNEASKGNLAGTLWFGLFAFLGCWIIATQILPHLIHSA